MQVSTPKASDLVRLSTRKRLSLNGDNELRYFLYMPAIVAMKCNSMMRTLKERLFERRSPVMAMVAAAMNKRLPMVYGVFQEQGAV